MARKRSNLHSNDLPARSPSRSEARRVRELRLDTAKLLEDVRAGESVAITLRGQTIATLRPARSERTWMPRDQFVGRILGLRPDRRLAGDVRAIAPEMIEDPE